MRSHGFSEQSIPAYLHNVRLFITYLGDLGVTNLAQADRKALAEYQLQVSLSLRRGKPLAHVTQRNRTVCLKTFFRFLGKSGGLSTDPTAFLELPRVRDQHPPNVLTKREGSWHSPMVPLPGGSAIGQSWSFSTPRASA
jgi:site-specific recombinase XerD